MSEELVTITVDGQELKAPKGAMLIEVTDQAGISIPRFCYHRKLSVAANCRMCLVEVEKAPKPMPACATPVMDGMIVHTKSKKAVDGQSATMEFLLINHPLDCPICDQGGECELQDVAMGYGQDISQYTEGKRVVFEKNIGPLIATEFTRCIHCTRCVRFGEEIAGMRELGATGRGENMQIGTYIEKSVASEMSGNVIDLCPVGALTAKPSRFKARAWEMMQYPSIAPHDSVGSNISVHTLRNEVVRVVPRDNEDINEAWISDRDRFAYEGVFSGDRINTPLVKQNGSWQETDWQNAISNAHDGLNNVVSNHDADQLAALSSGISTLEELYLLQKMMRGMGSHNIDHRLRQLDFSDQDIAPVMPWSGIAIAEFEKQEAVLLVGSNVRKEQPIISHRIRKAVVHHQAQVCSVNPKSYTFNFDQHCAINASMNGMVDNLSAVFKAVTEIAGSSVPSEVNSLVASAAVEDSHRKIATSLNEKQNSVVVLGNLAVSHPQFSAIRLLASLIADKTKSTLSYLPEQANTAGAWLAGAIPHRLAGGAKDEQAGSDVSDMFANPRKAMLLLNMEPELDCLNSKAAMDAMKQAEFVVVLTPFVTDAMKEYADVILPVATFAETSGTFVNAEGFWQSFRGCVTPAGDTRPAWKVLRVLANAFELDGFDQVSSEDVRAELKALCTDIELNNSVPVHAIENAAKPEAERIPEVPIYASDILVRRAASLQQTEDADVACVSISGQHAASANLTGAEKVCVKQNNKALVFPLVIDDSLSDSTIGLPAAIKETSELGDFNESLMLEKV